MTSPALIARVREATDLVALIAAYVPLKKQGTRWVGRCCFHEEKTASLGINERQHWHCFGCNQGGDAFEFLMKVENIPFGEALKRLAAAAGISLDEQPVTRKQMQYAREEAALCKWWWARREARMAAQAQRDYEGLED